MPLHYPDTLCTQMDSKSLSLHTHTPFWQGHNYTQLQPLGQDTVSEEDRLQSQSMTAKEIFLEDSCSLVDIHSHLSIPGDNLSVKR